MKLSLKSLFLVLSLTASGCGGEVKVSESEARDFGGKALARYCESQKLASERFTLKEIGPAGEFPWMLVFSSSGMVPAQEVVVSIDKRGRIETSRDVKP